MALRSKNNNRCRSTTDILSENNEKESLWPVKSSRANKSHSTEELNVSRKRTTGQKSQGFVKRLIASLERRNESCQANDEFWGTYYRPSCSYRSFENDKLAIVRYGTDDSGYPVAETKRSQDRLKAEENWFPSDDHRERQRSKTAEKSVRCDPHCHDDRRGSSLNRILDRQGKVGPFHLDAAEKEESRESTTLDRSGRNVSRKKSFKKFLGSVIKWRRTGEKEEPRRFLSCDDLIGTGGESQLRSFEESSKTLSLEAIADLDDGGEEKVEGHEKILRRGYDQARITNLPRVRIERKKKATRVENFAVSKMEESLVKPSAVKEIATRISRQPKQRSYARKY